MLAGPRPIWITFDCYGTLIQWDEGLVAAVRRILARTGAAVDVDAMLAAFDHHEHALEQARPHRSFREVSGLALERALQDCGVVADAHDATTLTDAIGAMPPFPEVVATLAQLKGAGFKLCIISNTDDAIIAGNVAQLGGHIDRVVTAERAGAYKPSPTIFAHAFDVIGATNEQVVHVCASPHLDLVATRALGLRAVWVDRGTGRQAPDGYRPDGIAATLDGVPPLFAAVGWM